MHDMHMRSLDGPIQDREMTKRMNSSWVDIIERAADENVGQTLIRLAKLAEATKRFQVAQQLAGSRQLCLEYGDDQDRADGSGSEPVVPCDRRHMSAASVRTEADR